MHICSLQCSLAGLPCAPDMYRRVDKASKVKKQPAPKMNNPASLNAAWLYAAVGNREKKRQNSAPGKLVLAWAVLCEPFLRVATTQDAYERERCSNTFHCQGGRGRERERECLTRKFLTF